MADACFWLKCVVIIGSALMLARLIQGLASESPVQCRVPKGEIEDIIFGYVCKVDQCLQKLIQTLHDEPCSEVWRKLPASVDMCGTNAQMSLRKVLDERSLLTFYLISNMLEVENKTDEICTALVVDPEMRYEAAKKVRESVPGCVVHTTSSVDDASSFAHHLPARAVKEGNGSGWVTDYAIVAPNGTSSMSLLQKFLETNYPPHFDICQVNLVYKLPRKREEAAFLSAWKRLIAGGKYLLVGVAKDRTEMHLNLFFVNLRVKYCRDRYLKYFSYW